MQWCQRPREELIELAYCSLPCSKMRTRSVAIVATSLVASISAPAQDLAAERAVAGAAVVLKLALGMKASRLTILTADRATWDEGEAQPSFTVERTGTCAFELKPPGSPGLRIDFARLSVPIQHTCGTQACSVRLSGVARAVCELPSAEGGQCRGFLQLGPFATPGRARAAKQHRAGASADELRAYQQTVGAKSRSRVSSRCLPREGEDRNLL